MSRQQRGCAVSEDTPGTREQRRRAIEAELRALPELEAPGTLWRSVEKRLDRSGRPQRRFFRPAFAAGAAAAALAAVVLLTGRDPAPAPHGVPDAPATEPLVAELMERSRLAETRRRTLPIIDAKRLPAVQGMEARRLLAERIAAVDASLNRLATNGPAEPMERERLWRERVELMDTLVRAEQVQREELIRRAVY